MAGEYIEFNNNSQPALNDTNINRMQQLIKQDIQGAVSGDTLPVGAIMPFGSDTIPDNWLLCNGQAVSRTTYQELFNTIGTTYGTGDGFTTFNLPDLKGKIPVGKDEDDTDFDTLGNTGGEKEHTLTINEMPSHSHMLQLRSYESASGTGQWHATYNGNESQSNVGSWETGGSQAHNILQPYIVQNYIIKAKQSAGIVATVVDGLNSTSATNALSANQGKVLSDKITPKYAIVTTTTNSSISTDFMVLLNSISSSQGNLFSLSNNQIVVGTGVSKVRISAGIFVDAPQGTGYVWGKILKGNNVCNSHIAPYANAGAFLSASITPTIVSVQQGDTFKLIADSTCGGVIRTGSSNTWVLIEAIE